MVTGVARRLGRDDRPTVADLPGWSGSADDCVVALSTELVSGRRMLSR